MLEVKPASRHNAICRQASFSTQVPMASMTPVSSAIGMNLSGGIRPRSGWRQRIRASTPRTRFFVAQTCGW